MEKINMNIAVIGTGYVGLVTSVCLAEVGNQVMCVDIDQEKVEKMKKGSIPIYEPGLSPLFIRNMHENRLLFTTSLEEGVNYADLIFLALPTPPNEDGSADLSHVLQVAKEIGQTMQSPKMIVNKSTVPIKTADKVRQIISAQTNIPFEVVSNPEFLREGLAVHDFMKPERIVIGSSSQQAIEKLVTLYEPFVSSEDQLIIMDEYSAELTKYAANSFLAMKITFMNELANICELTGADIEYVKQGIGSDSRIGHKFLNAGIGVGGSCFPKDMEALLNTAQTYDYEFKILKSVNEVNSYQRLVLVKKLLTYYKQNIKGRKIAVWGLSFKPDTDDIREAPALYIIEALLSHGAQVVVYDPQAMDNAKEKLKDTVEYTITSLEAVYQAEALLICTEWEVFKQVSLQEIKKAMKIPLIIDGRNIFAREEMEKQGFEYLSIGRDSVYAS